MESIFLTARFQGGPDSPVIILSESDGPNKDDLLAATYLAVCDSGIQVKVKYFDDGHNASQASGVAHQIVTEKAAAVIGHFSSICALAASEIYEEASLPFLAPGSSNIALCQNTIFTLRFFGRDDDQIACMAAEAVAGESVIIIGQKNNNGELLAEALVRNLSDKRIESRCYLLEEKASLGMLAEVFATRVPTIYILGRKSFCFDVVRRCTFHERSRVILSDDAWGIDLSELPHDNIQVPFLHAYGSGIFDSSVSELKQRAMDLCGKVPGPYFITSYLAVRALTCALKTQPNLRGRDLINTFKKSVWTTPYGDLSLSENHELQGLHWKLFGKRNMQTSEA
ncbi:ABC transporter substrate-binding protein [Photobacterium sp. WH77]|uniref:ABC transporter substrate-binding protein n=1 Tax=unclassified Photobacterium TaxID=2628852 RepID=UPI001C4779DD|nr:MULTISPECIES: ABC transporter substrate-binding protein [unclassified Photobacterium]MBV7262650.1 ABC transporter substrate-binding protein [Photobacterium sp. WH24]MCG2837779.1 ABC transporter substrate-binding protein [Photobacterium sp. WH77]MCG2845395.1 ABC transporter substrate-binding protein [Photobacterium sp. WH80]MDO6582177.1 ABC transporter substrate-binding protein [Photobacterium sp. 2_MG-2023]